MSAPANAALRPKAHIKKLEPGGMYPWHWVISAPLDAEAYDAGSVETFEEALRHVEAFEHAWNTSPAFVSAVLEEAGLPW